jgi:O-methyltransferase involved in polyketide biosynthesis
MPEPPALTWVPVDFERDRLAPALARAGLDGSRPTFVSWLGVIPYLTRLAVVDTLRQLPPCSLAVGYLPPNEAQDEDARPLGAVFEGVVRSLGEPFLTLTTPAEFATLVAEAGFTVIDDVGAHDIEPRYGVPAIGYERMALLRRRP